MSSHHNFLAKISPFVRQVIAVPRTRPTTWLHATLWCWSPRLSPLTHPWETLCLGDVVEGFVGLLFMLIMSLVLKILDHYQWSILSEFWCDLFIGLGSLLGPNSYPDYSGGVWKPIVFDHTCTFRFDVDFVVVVVVLDFVVVVVVLGSRKRSLPKSISVKFLVHKAGTVGWL